MTHAKPDRGSPSHATLRARIAAAQAAVADFAADLIVITDRENLMYFTGITEIECGGLVIPAAGEPVLVTLWLDELHFRDRLPWPIEPYVYGRDSLAAGLCRVINSRGFRAPRIACSKYFIEVGVFKTLERELPGMTIVDGTQLFYRVRAVKDAAEIALIRRAADCAMAGMEAAVTAVRPGMTETAVLGIAEQAMRAAGSEGHPFRMQVLNADRQMMVHPYATDTVIADNQAVVIHLGASVGGYIAKLSRTVGLGRVPDASIRIYDLVRRAQEAAIAAIRPGRPVREVYDAAWQVVDAAGLGPALIDDIGYGIGLRQSEFYPIIGRNRDHILERDMAVDLMFPTIYTPHGGGPRLADTVLIEDEAVVLTPYSHELIRKETT
ncbi:MAG: Xaa-Pro peptidase family protein [Bacillota bacterium]|nr:Xaa-Pro peptidase family protein [Bacillota bacterium]